MMDVANDKCPQCGSFNIVCNQRDYVRERMYEDCECEDCGSSFSFVYEFIGIEKED